MRSLWHRLFGHPPKPADYVGNTTPDGKSWSCSCGRWFTT